MLLAAILVIIGFLIGSIPFGFLVAKSQGIDIRTRGSGNIGATNVWRVLGPKFGLTCFVLDFLKGLGPTLLGYWALTGAMGKPVLGVALLDAPGGLGAQGGLGEQGGLVLLGVAVACVLGHMFTPWLGFKGGKGVATSFGALVGVFPVFTLAALAGFVVWLASVLFTRMIGISSVLAAAALAAAVWVEYLFPTRGLLAMLEPLTGSTRAGLADAAFATVLAAVVIFKHRANIKRTLSGTEPKIGQKKTES